LQTYVSAGVFGINSFAIALIAFVIIFMFVGIMSFKFGIRSPVAVMAAALGLVIFFEYLGFIPQPGGYTFASIIAGLIFVGVVVQEVVRG
jgi:hypothetical protein